MNDPISLTYFAGPAFAARRILADADASNVPPAHRTNGVRMRVLAPLLILAIALALSACGATVQPTPAPSAALDCVREGYPCAFSDVALPVLEQSLTLSEDAANQIESGASPADVVAFLRAQPDVDEVEVVDGVIVFRLAGGRPMIVDAMDRQLLIPDSSDPMVLETAGSTARTLALSAIPVAGASGAPERRALVLSPFRYEFTQAVGARVAAQLETVPGYAGNVTYIYTDDEHDPQVTVDLLTQMDGYDLIHIDTHGGSLCLNAAETLSTTSGSNCEGGITDILVQRFHGTAEDLQSLAHPGVVHYRGSRWQSIAVTADFFRHHYPEGLVDTVFVLASCSTYRADFATAIAGDTGVYISWDRVVAEPQVVTASEALIGALGEGLTVREAFATFETGGPAPQGQGGDPTDAAKLGHTTRRVGGDLRIRDLLTVYDGLTGADLSTATEIAVTLRPNDGTDDALVLDIVVDGIDPAKLELYAVNLSVDGEEIGAAPLAQVGEKISDHRYRIRGDAPLDFDANAGQTLPLRLWMYLPEGGVTEFVSNPTVLAEPTLEAPSVWHGTTTTVARGIGSVTTTVTNVTWELEPGQDADQRFVWYRVREGVMQISYQGDVNGCSVAFQTDLLLDPSAPNTFLKLDRDAEPVLYSGFGVAPGVPFEASGVCDDGQPLEYSTTIGGVWFVADEQPMDSDTSIMGSYTSGGQLETTIDWQFAAAE